MISANHMAQTNADLYVYDIFYTYIFSVFTCDHVLSDYFLKLHSYGPNVAFANE